MTKNAIPSTIFQKAKKHLHQVMNGDESKEAYKQRSTISSIIGVLCPVTYYLFTIASAGRISIDLTPLQFSMNLLILNTVIGLETNRQLNKVYKTSSRNTRSSI